MKLHSPPCFPIPPTHSTNLFSTGIKSSHTALFFNHLVHIKVTHERMVKRRKGPGTRQISLAFPSHNASHLNVPYIADHHSEWCLWWSVVFVVPHMNSKDPGDTFSSFCLWLQSYLERDVSEWQKQRGHQVQHWMLFTNLLTKSRSIKTMEAPQGITKQALTFF